jgi:aminomethyltransferase
MFAAALQGIVTLTAGYTALREHAALIQRSARGRILMTGEDRARLLHAMTTNDIQSLTPGQGCYAFFLNAQGRILADVRVACFGDHLLLSTEPETRAKVYEHLDRYIIADDVTLKDVTDSTTEFALEGQDAAAIIGGEVPLWSHVPLQAGFAQRTPAGFALIDATVAGIPEATAYDACTVRLEQGRARYGEEITERYLVQETGLLHAVSFHKGCYLGQEIVERVRSRAQVHRHLRSIEIDTATPPEPGTKLDGDTGEIVSAAYSPALGKTAAMAYMRTPQLEPGAQVALAGVSGRVRGPAQA